MSGICTPGYKTGFYSPRRGGIAKYPQLWRQCVAAWAPCLGQTGSRLYDQSLYQNHGTLQSMDAATAWVASEGKLALDFDGVNDYVDYTLPSSVFTTSATVSMWLKLDFATPSDSAKSGFAINATGQTLAGQSVYPFVNGLAYLNTFRTDRIDTITLSSSVTRTNWHLVTVTTDGTDWKLYQDRYLVHSASAQSSVSIDTNYLRIGQNYGGSGGGWINYEGQLDDIRLYNRALTPSEIALLSTRRGIAYERASRRSYYVAGGAPPVDNRRNNMLVGCGF